MQLQDSNRGDKHHGALLKANWQENPDGCTNTPPRTSRRETGSMESSKSPVGWGKRKTSYAQYRDGEFFDIVRNGDEFFETQSRNVTDWMQLPEPPL